MQLLALLYTEVKPLLIEQEYHIYQLYYDTYNTNGLDTHRYRRNNLIIFAWLGKTDPPAVLRVRYLLYIWMKVHYYYSCIYSVGFCTKGATCG